MIIHIVDDMQNLLVMLIRAGCVVLVSVVLALIPLYIGPSGYWNSRTSCIRNWSAFVFSSGGVFVIYTAGNPAFLFFPSQNSSNLARANNSAVDSINNYPLFIYHNYPLFIDVAWERHSGTFNNEAGLGHCFRLVIVFPSQNSSNLARANNNAVDSINNYPWSLYIFRYGYGMEFYSHRSKIRRSKCRCAYYANSTATFRCPLQGDLVFKLNPGPTDDRFSIHTRVSATARHAPFSNRTRNHSYLTMVNRSLLAKHPNTLSMVNNTTFRIPVVTSSTRSRQPKRSRHRENLTPLLRTSDAAVQNASPTELNFCLLNA